MNPIFTSENCIVSHSTHIPKTRKRNSGFYGTLEIIGRLGPGPVIDILFNFAYIITLRIDYQNKFMDTCARNEH